MREVPGTAGRLSRLILGVGIIFAGFLSGVSVLNTGSAWAASAYDAAVLGASPLAYYRLDQTDGTSAADSSGNDFTGTYNGAVTYAQPGTTSDGDTAISLPGASSGFVSTPSLTFSSAFTLSAWVNPANFLASGQQAETLFGTSLNPRNLVAYVPAVAGNTYANKFVVEMGGSLNFATQHTYAAGQWYFVVYTWDGTNQCIYVNAVLDTCGTATSTTAAPSWGGQTYVGIGGAASQPNPLQGGVDDVGLYTQALSSSQILTEYGSARTVFVYNGKLYYQGSRFKVRGVVYTPVPVGSFDPDPAAPQSDAPVVAAMHANTLVTSKIGQYTQAGKMTGDFTYYNALYQAAESNNLKIVVSHWYVPSVAQINWSNSSQVAMETTEYQNMVKAAMNRPSTLIYMVGNEVFENLTTSQQTAYAQWVNSMAVWTHSVDPNHPVAYAFSSAKSGLSTLKANAPNLDIIALNTYDWSTETALATEISNLNAQWPGKPIFIKESGSDSYDAGANAENQAAQANQDSQLVTAEDQVYSSYPVIGSSVFQFSDNWQLNGNPSVHDTGKMWNATSCFDGKASDEWFGLTQAVASGQAANRVKKSAYYSVQSAWSTP
jgi:hypothetical protein